MVHSFLFSSQFSCVISITTMDSEAAWKTVQILIRWLRKTPADLDLNCFLKKIYQIQQDKGNNNDNKKK